MTKITYIEHSGQEHTIDAEPDQSVMEAAIKHSVPGIVGECGGTLACATCHCYVDPEWMEKVGKPEAMEEAMLDFAKSPRQENSRLSCQIAVTDGIDGIVLRLPESQR
ncbi:2Fe-2S iron-sulfur cluster-binding protein [Actibacterium sp. D379-3]